MSSDLKVFCTADNGGCGFYRIKEPARVAQDEGIDISYGENLDIDGELFPDGTVKIHDVKFDGNVLVLQRPLLKAWKPVMQILQKRGVACIVEIDDDLTNIHPQNVASDILTPGVGNKAEDWQNLLACCAIADLVICSSDALAGVFAPHGRFRVARNYIPEAELYRPKTPADDLRLGWTGTVQTHPVDLDVAENHISALLTGYATDQDFYVVGDGVLVKEKLNIKGEVIATGWVPREDYIDTVNHHFDVGIVPLKLDKFNQSKSWLKQLEMASQGIPSVVSPTDENLLLAQITGNSVVHKSKDWQKHLKRFFIDRDYYLERSTAVREAVTPLTYENHVGDWIEAWEAARQNRSKRK